MLPLSHGLLAVREDFDRPHAGAVHGHLEVMPQVDHTADLSRDARGAVGDRHILRPERQCHRRAVGPVARPGNAQPAADERTSIAVVPALDEIHGADEVGHEQPLRPAIEDPWCVHLLHDALVHHGDPVGERQCLFLIVRDKDRRDADLALQRLQFFPHPHAQPRVEVAERFVQEQDLRLQDQRPRHGDALLLAAGQLVRPFACCMRETDQFERLAYLPVDRRGGQTPQPQTEGDVVRHGHMRPEIEPLKHHRRGAPLRRQRQHTVPLNQDIAAVRCDEAADHPQRRRLPASRRPQQAHQLTVMDIQREVVDRRRRPEALGEVSKLQAGHGQPQRV